MCIYNELLPINTLNKVFFSSVLNTLTKIIGFQTEFPLVNRFSNND